MIIANISLTIQQKSNHIVYTTHVYSRSELIIDNARSAILP